MNIRLAEFTNASLQTVASNQNVLLTETPVCGSKCIVHRNGSGIITLRGITEQCKARFKVSFGANISIPTGGAVGAISTALSISGEPLASATAIVTPAAVEELSNIYMSVFVEVPRGCCATVSAKNTSAQNINVQNANMIVERIS